MCSSSRSTNFASKCQLVFDLKDTHREKLNSVQEFVKVKSWLFLIFRTCLNNQLNSTKSTDV